MATIFILFVGLPLAVGILGSAVSLWTGRAFLSEYWRDWLSAFGGIGTLATLIGLGAAIWQIARTRSAAEAANQAANETKDRITKISALVDLTRLCSQSNEVLVLLREGKIVGAALRVWDLCVLVTQFRFSAQGKGTMSPKKWTEMMMNIKQLEEALQDRKPSPDGWDPSTARHLQAMSEIHERLLELAANAADPGEN